MARDPLGDIDAKLNNFAAKIKSAIIDAFDDIKFDNSKIKDIFGENLERQLKNMAADSKRIMDYTNSIAEGSGKLSSIYTSQANTQAKFLAYQKQLLSLRGKGLGIDGKIDKLLKESTKEYQKQNRLIEFQIQFYKDLEKRMGLIGKTLKGLGKIPILGDLLDADVALAKVRSAAIGGASGFNLLGVAARSLGKSLLENVLNPLILIDLAIRGLKYLKEIFEYDAKQTAALAKNLGLSAKEARGLMDTFRSQQDVFLNIQEAREAFEGMSRATGVVNSEFKNLTKGFNDLVQYYGLTNEEAEKLFTIGAKTGKFNTELVTSLTSQFVKLQAINKVRLNEKELVKSVANASAAVRVNLQSNPKALAEAAFYATRLKLSIDDIKNASEQTLNFEQSIKNELASELFLGKNINLESYRFFALTGKTNEASKELFRLINGNKDAIKGNVIVANQFAQTLGISSEQLFKSVEAIELANKYNTDSSKIQDAINVKMKQGFTYEEAVNSLGKERVDDIIKQGKAAVQLERTMAAIKQRIATAFLPIAQRVFSEKNLKLLEKIADSFINVAKAFKPLAEIIADNLGKLVLGIGAITLGRGIKAMLKRDGSSIDKALWVRNVGGLPGGGGLGGGTGGGGYYGLMGGPGGKVGLAQKLYRRAPGLGRFGRFAGKASIGGLLGGLALDYGADKAADSGNEGLATGLGTAGGALAGAGTGAMLGSFIPGVGTAVGAIAGGLYGGISSYLDRSKNKGYGYAAGGIAMKPQIAELAKNGPEVIGSENTFQKFLKSQEETNRLLREGNTDRKRSGNQPTTVSINPYSIASATTNNAPLQSSKLPDLYS
jgi:hypothetical protein